MFTDIAPKTRETEGKINKWDYIKLKSFFTVKDHQQNNKTTYILGEHICQ